ncbi:hypothetical protein QBC44DRAFT_74468 [Cladorrhinum sp. PSN332]|nr:hypothetical protein QBC44DRAFT_74468 [Cladorrhinum sp. PSN332]
MATRYSAEFLLHLRESPLCVKPPSLPPIEEWMGAPPETFRNQPGQKPNDRTKGGDGLLLNQENRRQPLDRNATRNASKHVDPDEMILGPPKINFASATMRNNRTGDGERGLKDLDRQNDRFNFRGRGNADTESSNDRFARDGRENRNGRNNDYRRRDDQDTDGWSTVKPRKSFGTEGAERFQGRMGIGMGAAGSDRFGGREPREDRRLRDKDEQEGGNRRNNRNADFRRDQDAEDGDAPRRNGLTRGKTDPWFKEGSGNSGGNDTAATSGRERIERKSWRDREPVDTSGDRHSDRHDRSHNKRWDHERQNRVENDPEWLDEPVGEKPQGRSEEDFRNFMATLKRGDAPPTSDEKPSSGLDKPSTSSFFEMDHKVVSAPPLEMGPDKFFANYGGPTVSASTPSAESREAAKAKAGKSSRFLSFLSAHDDGKPKTEPPTPAAPTQVQAQANETHASPDQTDEKKAFESLLQKLQQSGLGQHSSPPPPQPGLEQSQFTGPSLFDFQQKSNVSSPEPFQQYGNDRRDDPRFRGPPPPSLHDMMASRPMGQANQIMPVVTRPEQALQDLVAQRHSLPNQSNQRATQGTPVANKNANAEFLMRLMQTPSDPARNEPHQMRIPQPSKQMPLSNIPDREQFSFPREQTTPQRQPQLRGPGGPPGFLDENQFHPGDMDARPPPQPTHILQRPMPPPGLDHQMHPFHMVGPGAPSSAPVQNMHNQRPPPMIPPPGLLHSGPRTPNVGPMPGMPYGPNPSFPPGPGGPNGPANFPPGPPPPHAGGPPSGPPEGLMGPPRGMHPPPGFFPGPPPPGFMGPPPGMGGFQGSASGPPPPGPPGGPDGPGGRMGGGYGALPSPFELERRGLLPPGVFRGGP